MKGRIRNFLGSFVLAAAACVCGAAAEAGTPAGGVYITPRPAGADVWIDGTYVG
ncbi:MAG: hypothetical protein IAI49_04610, partial [Candidatus Eremiobacteraeota bacterium]|nr:hypothetical protein [Candidatus Eremiobacteraeota bacterium]